MNSAFRSSKMDSSWMKTPKLRIWKRYSSLDWSRGMIPHWSKEFVVNSLKPKSSLLIKLQIRMQILASQWRISSPKWTCCKITRQPRAPQSTANPSSAVSIIRRSKREITNSLGKITLLMPVLLHQFKSINKILQRKWGRIHHRKILLSPNKSQFLNSKLKSRKRKI